LNISEVEGIGPEHAAKLAEAGIHTTETLLERGATPRGRTGIEAATGISGKLILEWINHADLMRIDGVGSEYADLLEAAGVDSPAELAHRNAANLAGTFQEIDAARPDWIRRVPSEATVAGWIEQAKAMDRAVSHGAEQPAPAPAPGPAPVAAAKAAPASAANAAPVEPTTKAGATPAAPTSTGIWARIKRLFGGS
jgi:predicted flap endonuclease-1-like 5' DNA nuclease